MLQPVLQGGEENITRWCSDGGRYGRTGVVQFLRLLLQMITRDWSVMGRFSYPSWDNSMSMSSCKAGGHTGTASLVSEWIGRSDELLISKYVRE